MIVLDTNVISELMKPLPDLRVVAWLDDQPPDVLFVTSVVLAELLNGIEMLPEGKRKAGFRELLDEIVTDMIGNRVLSFDAPIARTFAMIHNAARTQGVSVGFADCQIAAAAVVQGFSVATRDTPPFTAMGCTVINPWTA
ncbi:MAG: type II toxin-antitoxin system VapC family toxin [Rhizobium sp.]|nr:type II toxin-antitoxin system VapC family toxin [Rhizobium sp.]